MNCCCNRWIFGIAINYLVVLFITRVVNCTRARLYQTHFIVRTVSQAGRFQLPSHTLRTGRTKPGLCDGSPVTASCHNISALLQKLVGPHLKGEKPHTYNYVFYLKKKTWHSFLFRIVLISTCNLWQLSTTETKQLSAKKRFYSL